eukprot:gene19340-21258_t
MRRQEALDCFSKLEDGMAQIVSLLSSGSGTGSLSNSNDGRPGPSKPTASAASSSVKAVLGQITQSLHPQQAA